MGYIKLSTFLSMFPISEKALPYLKVSGLRPLPLLIKAA
jgi:hypothetical protein